VRRKRKREIMRPTRSSLRGTFLATFGVLVAGHTTPSNGATVSLHPEVRHQTVIGWSALSWYPKVTVEVSDQVLDEAVGNPGSTWLHWTVPSGNRPGERSWERVNDDGDPLHVRWDAFGTETVDRSIRTWVLPFKRRVCGASMARFERSR
jgi:hypothetical protein